MSRFERQLEHIKAPSVGRVIRPANATKSRTKERYEVPGAGAILLPLNPGDQVRLVNPEGGQVAEIVTAYPGGQTDLGIIGVKARTRPKGLIKLLTSDIKSLSRLRMSLARRKIDLSKAFALRLFGESALAGDEEEFTANAKSIAIIAAPGDAMKVDTHRTSTPINVYVTRAKARTALSYELPDPLGKTLDELRIKSATARAYSVKAGDYIQILDVDGRQCTDFQCFDARKLDKGLEHPLDVTTTRTLQGAAYPIPGLHAKYYDQDMEPIVEVVQDTCGRHDALALACTAKYYEDMGYPGHANCSDNFNSAIEPFGVSARKGWMAMNIFYNTGIDEHGVMFLDEPWSRPGDYVLLRALTDIVCVSSACPDDTTAANGWNPTDIHIRTYSNKEQFTYAVANRPTPDKDPRMTKESGFHTSFAKHTNNFVDYRGYWLPQTFSNVTAIEEYWACREKAVVMDLSALRKFEVTGPDSEALLQYVLTRNVKKLSVGQVVYTAMCYEHGGMIDDGTLMRLGKDNFRWIGGDDYGGEWMREKARDLGMNVLVRSSTDQLHNIAVQGPRSRDILKEIIWTPPTQADLESLAWFRFTIGRIRSFDGTPVIVSRTGYTGELGYEIWCHPKDAKTVFDTVWDAGEAHGLTPMGLEALDMVRIEAGLVFAGYEFCDQTDPFEAGIGFTVPLKSKEDDFLGREALERRKSSPMKKLVGLEIDTNEDIGHGDCVHIGRAQIGVVTSGMRSPLLGKTIALARLDVTHTGIGTQVEIGKLDGHQKRIPAVVTPFPHYDPKKEKPRA